MPKSIMPANKARLKRLLKEREAAWDKVGDTINARPYVSTFLGTECEFVCEGMLPNDEVKSTNKAEALKMLADYYARETP